MFLFGGIIISYVTWFITGCPIIYILRENSLLSIRNVLLSGITAGLLLGVTLQHLMLGHAAAVADRITLGLAPLVYAMIVSVSFIALAHTRTDPNPDDR